MSQLPPYRDAAAIALDAAAAFSASAIIQKLIAYRALRLLYPDAPLWNLAIVVDYPARNFAEPMAALYEFAGAIDEIDVDHAIGAVLAPLYGERAN